MNEQQISEYIEFINELLACEFVTKAILYQKYSRLVDEALPKVMEIYATTALDSSSKMYLSDRRALLTESKTLTKNIGDWYQLNSQAFELSNQGEIAATITILQQALELARDNLPIPNKYQVASLNNLAGLYRSQGRWAEAEPLYKRALAICEELSGDSLRDGKAERPNDAVVATWTSLARLDELQRQSSAKAGLLYKRALAIREELSGERPNEVLATTLNNLARLYELQGRSAEAGSLYKQALPGDGELNNWNQLNSQANQLYRQGKFAAAIPSAQQALELAKKSFPVPNNLWEALSLNTLGSLYKSQVRWTEAEPLLDRALAICEKLFGEQPNEYLATCLNSLAELYKSQGRWAEAEPLYQRALAIFVELFGERPNDALHTCLNNLAGLYELQGRSAEAGSLYKRALQGDPEIWNQLNSQACELHRQGEIVAAIPIAQQALELARKSAPIPNNSLEAHSLNTLGALYMSQGRWTEVEPLLDRALAIRQELFGDRPNKDLAISLNSLAELYRSQGRWEEAEPRYEQALAICEELSGDSLRDGKAERPDDILATCLNNLAELYLLQGRWAKTEELHERSVAMFEELFGNRPNNDLASSLNNLGGLYKLQGRWTEAEPLFDRALAIRQVLFRDRPNRDLAISLNNSGLLYMYQERWDEAESHLYWALTINEKLFGESLRDGKAERPNDTLAVSLNNLALIYTRQGRWAEAESMYDRALVINEELFGERPNHYLVGNLTNLAQLYESQGRWTEAEPLYDRSLAIYKQLFGDIGHSDLVGHPNLVGASINLALFYARQQQPDKSLPLLQQAIEFENSWLTTVIAASDRQERLKDLERRQVNLEYLLSLTQQYFPSDPVAVTAALNAVLSRKGQATATEAALNQAIQQNPELAPDLQQLKTYHQEITALSYTIADRPELKDRLNTLLQQRKELERKLGRSIPAIDLAQQVVDRQALTSILPPDAFLVEFIRYRPYDFMHKEWQPARYLAFIVPPNSAEDVMAIDCGIAEDLDLAIDKFRRAYADIDFSGEHSGMGTQTIAELPAPKDDRKFQSDLLDRLLPHLPTTGTCYLATDSHLQILPFHPIETAEGEYFGDRYRLHHLITARDLLRHQRVPASTNPPIILADPDYDGGIAPTPSTHPKTGLQVSDRLDGQRFDRLEINRQFGERVARSYRATCYTDIAATVGRLERLNAPRLLFIATHGFSLPADRDDDPMLRSGIALAGANIWRFQGQEDPQFGKGVVFADDITQWNLWGNELSVLVTCVSGLGAVSNSEGVFGLRRALAIAGAKYVISSLWNIPTKPSVLLMNKFFEIYQSATKPTPAVALAQAQAYIRNITFGELSSSSIGREIIKELLAVRALSSIATDDVKPLADPYFWGAWICQG